MTRLGLLLFAGILFASNLVSLAAEPPAVGQPAPDFELPTLDDQQLKLSALAKSGPVVLVVLRGYPGYQCPLCTAQAGDFLGKAKRFAAAKCNVVFVYPGPAETLKEHAAEFLGDKKLPAGFHLVIDPDYSFTNRYGLRWDAKNETAYPATFVIDRQGKIQFAKVSRSHGDRASATAVLEIVPKK